MELDELVSDLEEGVLLPIVNEDGEEEDDDADLTSGSTTVQ